MRHLSGRFVVGLMAAALNASLVSGAHRGTSREQVLAVLEQRADAGRRRDVTAFDRLYADDYFHTNADGSVMDKAAVLASYRAPATLDHVASTTVTERLHLYDDCAVVSELATVSGVRDGEPVATRFRTTTVLRRTKGQWHIVSSHASVLRGDAGAPASGARNIFVDDVDGRSRVHEEGHGAAAVLAANRTVAPGTRVTKNRL